MLRLRAPADGEADLLSPWASAASWAHLPAHERAALAAQSIPSPSREARDSSAEASAALPERPSLKRKTISWAEEEVLVVVRHFWKVCSIDSQPDLYILAGSQGPLLPASSHCSPMICHPHAGVSACTPNI